MARGTRNSLNTYYLQDAIAIGAGSCVLTADPGTEMPTTETFSVNIGDLEGTAASQEVIDCTRLGTTLTFVGTTTKAHAVGSAVNLVFSENDYENFITKDVDILRGNGPPEGVLDSGIGTLYIDEDGTDKVMYLKRTVAGDFTGWQHWTDENFQASAPNSYYVVETTAVITPTVGPNSNYVNIDPVLASTGVIYMKNQNTGEVFTASSSGSGQLTSLSRGKFNTEKQPMTIGDTLEVTTTGVNAFVMDTVSFPEVRVNTQMSDAGIVEYILPDFNNETIPDGKRYIFGDDYGFFGSGGAIILTDPNGSSAEIYRPASFIEAIYDSTGQRWFFDFPPNEELINAKPEDLNVIVASAAALHRSPTYNAGTKRLTAGSAGVLIIDGYTCVGGEFVLVKDNTTSNGIYKVINSNSGNNYIIERAEFMNQSSHFVPGMTINVSQGSTNADSVWQLSTDASITMDTTSLVFTRAGGKNSVLSKTANYTVTVDDDKQFISYTTLAAARTVTLPSLSAVDEGFSIWVLDSTTGTHADTNNITIQRAGSDLFVGGGTTTVINTANGYRQIIKVNSRWMVITSG